MKKYKSLFLSDIHLGSNYAQSKELFELLESIEIENLFLVGDVFNQGASSKSADIVKFKDILSNKQWNIIYILGNHEKDRKLPRIELLPHINPLNEYIYKNGKNAIYLTHGDSFHDKDIFNKLLRYTLQKVKRVAKARMLKKEKRLKSRRATIYHTIVKPFAQKFLHDSYVKYITKKAEQKECQIAICGHIHLPEKLKQGNTLYLNCGDWIKYNSYIVEDYEGNLTLYSKG